tara:strand:+ start:547 stop:801 length:255 start_codon:yes stop_codon:yes gene_type:complete
MQTLASDNLTKIFRDILEIDDLVLTPELSFRDIEEWDSFNHLNIILAVEEQFQIQFKPEEIESITSVQDLVSLMNRCGFDIEWK